MATTKTSPLDSFVAATTVNSLRINPVPKLSEFVKAYGFTAGMQKHEEAFEEWRLTLERSINERLQPKAEVSTGKL